MSTNRADTSVRDELDELIRQADQLDRNQAALDTRCNRLWVEAEIARFEAMNPLQVQAMARFADLEVAF